MKKKVVLAYSGGLDTTVIIPWLKENYDYDVIAVCVNVGQGKETDGLEQKALNTGACKYFLADCEEEFVADYVFPTMKAGAVYEDVNACPEALLLFFHRLRYTHPLADGKTLIQRVYDLHFEGAEGAQALLAQWETLAGKVPDAAFVNVLGRLIRQVKNAREWRDVVNTYFYRYSGIADEQGRVIYP